MLYVLTKVASAHNYLLRIRKRNSRCIRIIRGSEPVVLCIGVSVFRVHIEVRINILLLLLYCHADTLELMLIDDQDVVIMEW